MPPDHDSLARLVNRPQKPESGPAVQSAPDSPGDSIPIDISVVVATRNRAQFLPPTLESFQRVESALSWELILVDNGSTDSTPDLLQGFGAAARMPVKILREPGRGASRARNLGWRNAAGAIVAFTDDDCYPATDWLDRLSECFHRSTVGYAGGRILLFDPTDYPFTIMERMEPFDLLPGKFIPAGAIQGANWAARRIALEQVEGFDPELGPGTPWVCEELELQARMSAVGWTGAYESGPVVYHHHRRKTLEDIRGVNAGYAQGRGAYRMKGMLDPRMRPVWARHWYWDIRTQPLRTTVMEFWGATSYLMRRHTAR